MAFNDSTTASNVTTARPAIREAGAGNPCSPGAIASPEGCAERDRVCIQARASTEIAHPC